MEEKIAQLEADKKIMRNLLLWVVSQLGREEIELEMNENWWDDYCRLCLDYTPEQIATSKRIANPD